MEPGADLTDSNISAAQLQAAGTVTGVDVSENNLSGFDLTGADLFGATLESVDLTDVSLKDSDLTNADLRRADLTGAILSHANLGERGLVFDKPNQCELSGSHHRQSPLLFQYNTPLQLRSSCQRLELSTVLQLCRRPVL